MLSSVKIKTRILVLMLRSMFEKMWNKFLKTNKIEKQIKKY